MLREPLIRLRDVAVHRENTPVMQPLSLEVSSGECVCIVGPTGTGKSLLLELLAGRHIPHSGQVSYPAWASVFADAHLGIVPRFTTRLVSTNEQRRLCSQVLAFHQARWSSSFSESLLVANFLEPRRVFGLHEYEVTPVELDLAEVTRNQTRLLEQLAIGHLLPRPLAALSNGEWRKLLLARALLIQPQLLILDDPLGGLDPTARERAIAVIREYAMAHPSLTIVCATTRPDEIQALTPRVVELTASRFSVPQQHPEKLIQPRASLASAAAGSSRSLERGAANHVRPVIDLRHATVHAANSVLLNDVSLRVMPGEHWLITGQNGAGKSTLLALLMGDHPQSYVVDLEVLGLRAQPGISLSERQSPIGYMAPELAAHYPLQWSINDVILSGLHGTLGHFAAVSAPEQQKADTWLGWLGLRERAKEPLASLSEATTRRVFLARALIKEPTLLILDEPTQGLGVVERTEMLQLLDELAERMHFTLLMVSHHATERPRCITHHLELHAGTVLRCESV